ncbi:relaxase/mobilization nuclease domain-containing protein [Aestuariibius insulae]|uniref:relaxase/mobilization nuclease domain-containing protein n=1 Tax=Aestuariibius insulae TaxID=2058287 RepID=UPI00345F064B
MSRDDDLRLRPGRIRSTRTPRAKPFVAQALRAAQKAGGLSKGKRIATRRTSHGRGGSAAFRAGRQVGPSARRVTVKARVVRHGKRSAPLGAHLIYLKRDGVSREGEPGRFFDAGDQSADGNAFAERCADDRHHFRFIVSPEDAHELADLTTFTRDVMATAERDLGTELDWIAVDHWNTEHPHVHVLLRGVDQHGETLTISRDYISAGLRHRASERATLELGPRSERDIEASVMREVEADRWTGLDRTLQREAVDGVVDLRPRFGERPDAFDAAKIGRMRKLEGLGLAQPVGTSQWRLSDDVEPKLGALQRRGDIIARLHDALGAEKAQTRGLSSFDLDGTRPGSSVLGRLAARGLDDELTGSAFVVIEGIDGRSHHVGLADLEAASDAPIGAVVEARWTEAIDPRRSRLVVSVRSDLDLAAQTTADGATWLDRRLVAKTSMAIAETGFGGEVREAMGARLDHLERQGLAERHGQRHVLARNLLATLRDRELTATAEKIAAETGLTYRAVEDGGTVSGTMARRLSLASGRFAMIDDGTGFQLVPWSQPLERKLGRHVTGVASGSGVDWDLGRLKTRGV